MADFHRHPTDDRKGDTLLTNIDNVPATDEYRHERTGISLNVKHSGDGEAKNENSEDMKQVGFSMGDSDEVRLVHLIEASSYPNEANTLTGADNSTLAQSDNGNNGQCHSGENEATTPSASSMDTKRHEQVDGPGARNNKETIEANNKDLNATEDDEIGLDMQENTASLQTPLPQEKPDKDEVDARGDNIETIASVLYTLESTEPVVPVVTGSPGGNGRFLLVVVIGIVIAVLVPRLFQHEDLPQKEDPHQIFLRHMDKLETHFPNQRTELWIRSRIHLLNHLRIAQPTKPVSLILTSGVTAKQTLLCLAQGLASAISSALNASILHIDGATKASQESNQVKLDIDHQLQGAFEGDKPVAVIHRFEELPPESTLIFYRYCDHENAAYKRAFLIFTVLLAEEEIPAKSHLSTVEEMVDDYLQKKFLSGHPVSFDMMNLDKYGGLWSRISHLILPVTAEKQMEKKGCKDT